MTTSLEPLARGEYKSVKEIATDEGITSPSCASRVLRLVLLAPDIQETILNSTDTATVALADCMIPSPGYGNCNRGSTDSEDG